MPGLARSERFCYVCRIVSGNYDRLPVSGENGDAAVVHETLCLQCIHVLIASGDKNIGISSILNLSAQNLSPVEVEHNAHIRFIFVDLAKLSEGTGKARCAEDVDLLCRGLTQPISGDGQKRGHEQCNKR